MFVVRVFRDQSVSVDLVFDSSSSSYFFGVRFPRQIFRGQSLSSEAFRGTSPSLEPFFVCSLRPESQAAGPGPALHAMQRQGVVPEDSSPQPFDQRVREG